jgi:hypothetical protein
LNRHTATTSTAWAFPDHRQPQHVGACCGLNRAEKPYGTGIVALWRIETPVPAILVIGILVQPINFGK